MAWYWHRLVPLIRAAGHEPLAIDLPGDDRHAGLAAYADTVARAIGERSDVILVAQSLAGFTAPRACDRADDRVRQRDDPKARRDRWRMVGLDRRVRAEEQAVRHRWRGGRARRRRHLRFQRAAFRQA